MGSRKSKRVKPKKIVMKDESRFDCPKCNHEKVVHCKVIRTAQKGVAICTVCDAKFRCDVTPLDKSIDIYHAWMDELNS